MYFHKQSADGRRTHRCPYLFLPVQPNGRNHVSLFTHCLVTSWKMKNCTGKCFSKFVSVCVSVEFEGVKGIVLFPIRKCPTLTQTMTEYWATEHDEEENHLKHWWQLNWTLWLCFLSVLYLEVRRIYFYLLLPLVRQSMSI